MKNIQPIVDLNAYEAFGFSVQNKPDQVSYYYTRGLTHTTGQKLVYRTFTGLSGTPVISDFILINAEMAGASGGQMDDGTTIIFSTKFHTDGTRDIYMIKADADNNFSEPVLFDWNTVTKLTSGFFYGPLINGDSPGEYYHIIYQTTTGRFTGTIIKTTDYWHTYIAVGVIYDGSTPYGEFVGINLGVGKLLSISRQSNAGGLITFESTNYGVTWVRRPVGNLYWYMGGNPEIPWIYGHDGVFDVFYECRDTSMMHISKGNTVLNNFGKPTPVYNVPEVYCYHRGTGGNPSLGYGSQLKLSNGIFFMIYSKEYTNTRANLQWTFDDLVSDNSSQTSTIDTNPTGVITVTTPAPATGISYSIDGINYDNMTGIFDGLQLGIYNITAKITTGIPTLPAIPELSVSSITTTGFRIDVTNYGDWQNIRYCLIDLSTSPDFSTFITCKYRAVSAFPVAIINNIRMIGYFVPFNALVSGTTYFFRIKGCNNSGCSDYTIKQVTTL